MSMLSCSECNLDLHIPLKREDWKFIFLKKWKMRNWFLSLRIIAV